MFLCWPLLLSFQLNLNALVQYGTALAVLFERSCEDELVKPAVAAALSKGAIGFRLVDSVSGVTGENQVHGLYNGVQAVDGGIFAFTEPKKFWANVYEIENLGDKFFPILPRVGGGDALPIRLQQEVRKLQAKCDDVVARIKKATGLEKITWDIVGDANTILKTPPTEKLNPDTVRTKGMTQAPSESAISLRRTN